MPKKLTFQTVVYILLAVAFLYAIYSYRDQLNDIANILQHGIWYYVAASILVLLAVIYVQTALYSSIYAIFEVPSAKKRILPLYLVTRFVTVAAPSGGLSAFVPFLQYARRGEVGVGRIIIANLVRTILWYSSFGFFLLLGLGYLFLAHDLQWFELSASIVVFVANLTMVLALVLSWVAPRLLERILHTVARLLEQIFGWIHQKPPVTDKQMTIFVRDLNRAVSQMRVVGWRGLLVPVGYAFLNETLNLAMLYLLARAFMLDLSFGIIVTAYSISILFFIVSPTPGGLGFVEGAMILVMTTLDVPQDKAAVVTLAFRGISFWGPFILGFLALRWTRHPTGRVVERSEVLSENSDDVNLIR